MKSVTFVVRGKPPCKQIRDPNPPYKQKRRLAHLQREARAAFRHRKPFSGPCCMSIRYFRNETGTPGASIIGEIAGGLKEIVLQDDKQLQKISYVEYESNRDLYQVTVAQRVE